MVEKHLVYVHITPNNKRYYGVTNLDVKKRWKNGQGYKGQYFYKAILKYGWDNIEHKILIHGLTKEQAERWEIKLIKYYKSNNPKYGYNQTEGGYNPPNFKGDKNPMFGKTGELNPQFGKTGILNKQSIKVYCVELNTIFFSIREAERKTGCRNSDIVRCCKNKKSICGGYHWLYYTDFLNLDKQNISDLLLYNGKCCKPVLCVELNKIFVSAKEASKELNIYKANIQKCCRKEKHYITAGGYHWEYYTPK